MRRSASAVTPPRAAPPRGSRVASVTLCLLVATAVHAQTPPDAPTTTPTRTRTATRTATWSPTPTPTVTPTPLLLVADTNCDGRGTAADFVAAILVSGDGTQFAGCSYADPYRDVPLADSNLVPILHDLFGTFNPPYTPTPTATPTITGTSTPIPTPTATPRISVTPTGTATATATPTPSPSFTATFLPTRTRTPTPTFTPTRTRTPTQTPTPTGFAYQLSGNWSVDWANQTASICFDPNGQVFFKMTDSVYRVTAINGAFDIATIQGTQIGRGVPVDQSGTVIFEYATGSGNFCNGTEAAFVFDFTLTFRTNGTGTGSVHWTYGANTNCFVCDKTDTAVLHRTSGPGT